MRRKMTIFSGMLAIVVLVASELSAHHGTAAYDATGFVMVEGTVTEFDFGNPHALLFFDVKNRRGRIEKWQGELTSPNHLVREGWSRKSLIRGQHIKVSGYPAKSGDRSIWIQKIRTGDGKDLPLSGGAYDRDLHKEGGSPDRKRSLSSEPVGSMNNSESTKKP
jgi:hypothetical protein